MWEYPPDFDSAEYDDYHAWDCEDDIVYLDSYDEACIMESLKFKEV